MVNNDELEKNMITNTDGKLANDEAAKKKEEKKKKSKKILFLIGFTSILFIAATYAWFIGLSEVNVTEFNIDVKSSDGLQISLDGIDFSDSVTISADSYDIETYPGNTNKWLNEEDDEEIDKNGLVPISSFGRIDNESSRLMLYNKTSIQALAGGYRLRSTLVENGMKEEPVNPAEPDGEKHNVLQAEQDGYVVFDLFIRNNSGRNYDETYNAENDEEIYLLTQSSVYTKVNDAFTDEIGLENSIRVAMMQIGRVNRFTTTTELTQGISCAKQNPVSGEVNGEEIPPFVENEGEVNLCSIGSSTDDFSRGVTWNIWEPNDDLHTEESLKHFNRLCKTRTSSGEGSTYSGNCTFPTGANQYSYVVSANIDSADDVNIYDGLNGYTGSTKLQRLVTFTDTDKMTKPYDPDAEDEEEEEGEEEITDKIPFFKLAPNSITKIRVYVYLEGQDVDNFDLVIDDDKVTQISVNFGFTKDRYEYDGGEVEITFDANGGHFGDDTTSTTTIKTVEYDTVLATLETPPTKDGSTFAGWTLGENDYDFTKKVRHAFTLKAKWETAGT